MTIHDYNLANATGADFRTDLNNVLQAVLTNNSSATEPTTTAAYMWWFDTANSVLKVRNSSDTGWVTLPVSISADNTVNIDGGTVNGITSFSFDSGSTVTSVLDEDDLNSDSASALATQQSIKAYVDAQVTAQDLDFQADSGGALSIDLDSESLTVSGGTGIDTSGSGNEITVAIDSTVATKTYVQQQITAEDLDFQADSGGSLSIDLDSETFTLSGGTGIDTVGSENTVTFAIDSTVATLTGSQTLTNKTIDVDNNTVSNIEVDNLKSGVLDTDLSSVSSNDDTLASSKAIKAYVDSQVTAQDLDLSDGTTAISIDLDSETLSVLGGTGVTSTASGNGVTLAIGQDVGTTADVNFNTVTAALTGNVTGNASTATTLQTARNISGVSFDGSANITLDTSHIGENGNLYHTTERVQDVVGGMVTSNTESGITVTYDDNDGTLDFVIGTLNQDTTGNAATATALETARTIGGVSFDGSANIDLPGVNTAGNQNTTGNAATATALATARTIGGVSFDGTANINLPGVNTAGNQNTSGNAATATALATGRNFSLTGDVTASAVSFDGTGNIALSTTIAANSVALGTDTTGNYVASLVAGTGVTLSNNSGETATPTVAIGQAVGTTDDVTFNDLTVSGNLTVSGTTTNVNTETINLADNQIVLNSNYTGSSPTENGGIEIERGTQTNKTLIWNETDDKWSVGSEAFVAGSLDIGGGSTNGVVIEQGAISIKNGGTKSRVDFYCESSNAHYTRLEAAAHASYSGNPTVTLPTSTGTLALTSDDITGNAATATALATARTIHGVSFDGSANIDLSEEIQDTVGAMFSSNTETGISATYQDSDGTIDLEIGSGSITNAMLANSSITVTDGTNSTATALGGTITFTASEGIDITESSGTVTISAEDATTSNKGIASFSSDFTVSSGAVSLPNSGVTAASYGSATAIPVITVDAKGRVTSASTANISTSFTLSDGSTTQTIAGGDTLTVSGTSNEVDVAVSATDTLTIGLPNDVTISNDLTVSGNLTVTGTTTQTGSVVTDNNFTGLTNANSGNATDFGFYGKYVESSTTKYAGIFYDASTDNTFRLFVDSQTAPSTTVNTGATGYAAADLVIGDLTTSGITIGSTAVTSTAAEINLLDGSSANTVVNSKAVIYGSSGELAGTLSTAAQTNITSVGTLSALTVAGDLTVDTNTLKVDSSNNRIGILDATPAVSLDIGSATDAIHVPSGTTAQRPTGANGMFRYNSTDNQFEGYADGAWGAIAGSGSSGASAMETDNFTGDDATTAFTLSSSVSDEDNLIVFIEGVYQNKGDYVASGNTITFDSAPLAGRKIVVHHVRAAISGSNCILNSFTGDGSDTTFTLTQNPASENNTQIFIDGVYQRKDSYSVSGTTLTFDAAPANGTAIEVMMFTQTDINTLPASFVSGLTEVTAVGADHMMIFDATDSALKKALVSDVIEGSVKTVQDADGDTKIQVEESSDEDKIRFDTGGTERAIIDSIGIGINTSSPQKKLHILGQDGSTGLTEGNSRTQLFLENNQACYINIASANNNKGGIFFSDVDANNQGAVRYDHNDDSLTFDTANSERFRVDSSGNVGIGTSSPAKQLEIRNNTATTGAGGAELRLTRGDSSGAENDPIGTIEFYNTDADGAHVSSFIKAISREQYARKGALTFGVASSTSTDATEVMRLNELAHVELNRGVGLYTDNLRAANLSITSSFSNALDFSYVGGLGAGRGFYLVTVVREGASVGTSIVLLVGLSTGSAVIIYDTISSNSLVAQTSGANLQIRSTGGSITCHATAVPIGITGLDS